MLNSAFYFRATCRQRKDAAQIQTELIRQRISHSTEPNSRRASFGVSKRKTRTIENV